MLAAFRRRYLDLFGSIYIYNEHRGYTSIDRVLEAVKARAPDDTQLIADIEKVLYSGGAGKGNMQNPARVGTIYYNRGVIAAVNYVEALRNAQRIHNKVGKPVNGAEFRDGYEALDYTSEARRKELGIDGMLPPYKLTCRNHEGPARST